VNEAKFDTLIESTVKQRAISIAHEILSIDYEAQKKAEKKGYKNLTQRETNALMNQINRAVNNIGNYT